MMYGWDNGNGYGYGIWNFIFMTLLMFLVVVGIIWCVHHFSHNGHNIPGSSDEPLSILKKRYANGEIDKKEFEEKKKDLES